MLTFLIAASALGVGLWMLLIGLVPPKPTLAQQMARVGTARPRPGGSASSIEPLQERLEAHAAATLAKLGLPGTRTRSALALLERPVEPLLVQKVLTAFFGLMLPACSLVMLTMAGVAVPVAVPVAAGLLLGAALFFVPDLAVAAEAEEYRRSARMAVRVFLDQAVTALAGGAGIENAMLSAAADGHGPTFHKIRAALETSRLRREAAWLHLDTLGRNLGIRELSELAAACSLAGSEGAKIKSSIAAKARSMRERELAEHIEAAESATERLAVPGGLLGLTFICFLLYAALAAAARQM